MEELQEQFRNVIDFAESSNVFEDDEAVFGLIELLLSEADLTPEERERLEEINRKVTESDTVIVDCEDANFILDLAEKYNIII